MLQGHDALVDLTTVVARIPRRVGDLFGPDGRLPSGQQGYARVGPHIVDFGGGGWKESTVPGTWGANRRRPPEGLAERFICQSSRCRLAEIPPLVAMPL